MDFADWAANQVVALRKLGFHVADKTVARALVELHNLGAFDGGLVLVGTLGYKAWLNELCVAAVVARTQDIDLACRQPLKLAAPIAFLASLQATGLPFMPVPELPFKESSISIKLPGVQALRGRRPRSRHAFRRHHPRAGTDLGCLGRPPLRSDAFSPIRPDGPAQTFR